MIAYGRMIKITNTNYWMKPFLYRKFGQLKTANVKLILPHSLSNSIAHQ